eukprot:11080965-Alexandrium_andersonii.AAC.1
MLAAATLNHREPFQCRHRLAVAMCQSLQTGGVAGGTGAREPGHPEGSQSQPLDAGASHGAPEA